MSILEVKNLVKVYGEVNQVKTKALDGLNLNVNNGELIAIMGPSGSGKTTFLNLISGIDTPSSGEIKISGTSINSMSNEKLAIFRRQKLGFVFQEFNLLDSLSIRENIMLPMILDKKKVKEINRNTDELINLFEINDIKNKYPYNVSGGQQQRTAVCRALVNQPSIVFADEPTGNLDSKSSKNIMEYFGKMNKERNSTFLVVTHEPLAASFCNRVVFIKDGQVHMEIVKKHDRKELFERILDCLAVIGGERYDI
ncbi:MAG: ABC transporter ATP-binding protein [Clostridiales bacterium]